MRWWLHAGCSSSVPGPPAMSEQTKPRLSEAQVVELVQRLYGLELSAVRPLPSYDDQNFHVVVPRGGGEYVLKIMNSVDSINPTVIDVQTQAMSFLQEHGIPAQTAVRNAAGGLMNLEEIGERLGSAVMSEHLSPVWVHDVLLINTSVNQNTGPVSCQCSYPR